MFCKLTAKTYLTKNLFCAPKDFCQHFFKKGIRAAQEQAGLSAQKKRATPPRAPAACSKISES